METPVAEVIAGDTVLAPRYLAGNQPANRLVRGASFSPRRIAGLQRSIGNRAVQRLLRSTPTLLVERNSDSGLAKEAPTSAMASSAYEFWAANENKSKPLTALAEHLTIQVSASLRAVPGEPPPPRLIFKTGVGYSGFVKKDWELVFDTSMLSSHVGAAQASRRLWFFHNNLTVPRRYRSECARTSRRCRGVAE